jgi:UDP-N-acetyl-D-mannosaminuronic acid transferase (WecB/TagA/CpsF family)
MLWRERHELRELRRIELVQETVFALAKLQAEAANSNAEVAAIMRKASAVHDASVTVYNELREKLPNAVRRLTDGYEMRTYWFASRAVEHHWPPIW